MRIREGEREKRKETQTRCAWFSTIRLPTRTRFGYSLPTCIPLSSIFFSYLLLLPSSFLYFSFLPFSYCSIREGKTNFSSEDGSTPDVSSPLSTINATTIPLDTKTPLSRYHHRRDHVYYFLLPSSTISTPLTHEHSSLFPASPSPTVRPPTAIAVVAFVQPLSTTPVRAVVL